MDISEWKEVAQPLVPKPAAERYSLSPVMVGLLGTLLLHALIVESLYRAPKKYMPVTAIQDIGPTTVKSEGRSNEGLLVVQLMSGMVSRVSTVLDSNFLGLLSKPYFPVSVDVDTPAMIVNLAVTEVDGSDTSESKGGGAAEKMRLLGLYSGQLQARIERAWRRPRSPVESVTRRAASGTFQCTAQIVEDIAGNVQEILLLRCNGTPQWQSSLLTAIRDASPLPAPPDPDVFSRSVTLNFLGFPFAKGQSVDGYEVAVLPARLQ